MAIDEIVKAPLTKQPQVKPTVHHGWGARLFLIIMCAIFLIPVYWMVVTALKTPAELLKPSPSWFPKTFAWSNFKDAVNALPFGRFFVNSVIITALVALGTVVSNVIVAYGFACIEWRGRDKLFYVVIATMFLPFAITVIPLFDLFGWLHWINTWFPLIVPAFLGSGFSTFLLRQVGEKQARDLLLTGRIIGTEEAAKMGLVNEVVAPEALMARARELAALLMENSPASLRATKKLLNDHARAELDTQIEAAVRENAAIRTSADFREGVTSFLEKRKPVWSGK